jgi:glutathione S-transferase
LKLYYHPASTTCRPIMLLAAADKIAVDYQLIDLFGGENYQPAFTAINPNQAVPYLEDGAFRLGESSAILKYLADKHNSPAYPRELQRRARVNERMDWFNTGLYRDLGYRFIYPQVIDAYRHPQAEVQAATLAHASEKAKKWLKVLDEKIIGPKHSFVCGDELTLADYLGVCMITLGEVIRLDYSSYPNLTCWLDKMKSLPYWSEINKAFYSQFVAMCRDTAFEGL